MTIRARLSSWAVLGSLTVATLCEAQAQSTPSKHSAGYRSQFITYEGARLHYLDWGGSGPVVVLLPGYALTAHAFSDIGNLLKDDFRVVAITPVGFGESDAPKARSYTVAAMVADLRALLDSLSIQSVALVGHSISGSTITEFARLYPERVTKLIFLDAFPYFAELGGDSVDALSPVEQHGFSGEMTYQRVREFLSRYRFGGWSPALEADLRANVLGDELARRRSLTDGYVQDQISNPPDLTTIAKPALQVCAVTSVATEFPWLQAGTREYTQAGTYLQDVLRPFNRKLCQHFTELVRGGQTEDVAGSHYVFFTQPSLTARLIRRFLN